MDKNNQVQDYFPRATPKKQKINSDKINTSSLCLEKNHSYSYITAKSLSAGCTIIGIINHFKDNGFLISLPYHLTGYLDVSHVVEENVEINLNDILNYYKFGNLVLCVVLSVDDNNINLSIRPSLLNAGYTLDNLKAGMWVSCVIKSIEDFGFTASLQTLNVKLMVQIDKNDLNCMSLCENMISYVGIQNINLESLYITCTTNPTKIFLPQNASFDSLMLRSGLLLEGVVDSIQNNFSTENSNMNIESSPRVCKILCCKVIHCTLPILFNIDPSSCNEKEMLSLKKGDKLLVRVIATIPSKQLILVSLLDNLKKWLAIPSAYHLKPGLVIKNSQVICSDVMYGARLKFDLENSSFYADVEKHSCSNSGTVILKVGQQISEAKVISYSFFDNTLKVVTSPNLLVDFPLIAADLKIGQVVNGKVMHVTQNRIVVLINKRIIGYISNHFGLDSSVVENSSSTFSKGADVTCCVIFISAYQNMVWLSTKKYLVANAEQMIQKYTDIKRNQMVFGVIGKIHENKPYVSIHFFNQLRGKIQINQFQLSNKVKKLKEGAVAHFKVSAIDYFNNYIDLNLNTLDTLNPTSSSLLMDSVFNYYISLNETHVNGCTIDQIIQHFESLPFKDNIFFNKKINHSGIIVIPSLLNMKSNLCVFMSLLFITLVFLKPGSIISDLIAFFGPVDDYYLVLYTFFDPHEHYSRTIPMKLFQQMYNYDQTVEFSYALLNHPNSKLLGLSYVPISHLTDDFNLIQKEKKITFDSMNPYNIIDTRNAVVLSTCFKIKLMSSPESNFVSPIVSCKQSLSEASKRNKFLKNPQDISKFKNAIVSGYVMNITTKGLFVSFGDPNCIGFIPYKFCVIETDKSLSDTYHIGQSINFRITQVENYTSPNFKYKPFVGDMISIKQVFPKRDGHGKDLLSAESNISKRIVKLFMNSNPSHINIDVKQVSVGQEYPAYVKIGTKKGVFVYISPSIQVRIKLSELPDSPISPDKISTLYPPYKYIDRIKIIEIKIDKTNTLQIEGSIKKAGQIYVTFEDLKVGSYAAGKIKKLLDNGIIISIESSYIDVLYSYKMLFNDSTSNNDSKIDEYYDQHKKECLAKYRIGDSVAVYITHVDEVKKKIFVDLSHKYFNENFETVQEKLQKKYGLVNNNKTNHINLSDVISDVTTCDSDNMIESTQLISNLTRKRSLPSDIYTNVVDPIKRHKKKKKSLPPPIADIDGVNEDASKNCFDMVYDEEAKQKKMNKREKRKMNAKKITEEEELHAAELEFANAEDNDDIIESVHDFERKLISEKNSSYIWIRYIAHHLKYKNLEKARSVAERAVNAIITSTEKERYNVWIVYLNMEIHHGNEVTLNSLLKRAIKYNDSKKIYMHIIHAFHKKNDVEKCVYYSKQATEKYPQSKKFWIRYLTCIYEFENDITKENKIQGVLSKALKSLPLKKHICIVSSVARLEFKFGSFEKGLSYFDKLMSEYPKRIDIWSQYIDCLINEYSQNKINIFTLRNAFQKASEKDYLKPRQIKFVFTRWLSFEKQYGTHQDQSIVIEKARTYVEQYQNVNV